MKDYAALAGWLLVRDSVGYIHSNLGLDSDSGKVRIKKVT
jgi:hypothetical protein